MWGKSPDSGRVLVQQQVGGGWRTIAVLHPGANRVFYNVIKYRASANLRAVSRTGAVSIDWPRRENLLTTNPNG